MAKKPLYPAKVLFTRLSRIPRFLINTAGTPQSYSPPYRLAYEDFDFIMYDEQVEESVITQYVRKLIQYAETAEQTWHPILESCTINDNNHYDKRKATL